MIEPVEEPGSADDTYLSRGEAARRLGVPPRTIQQWARDGKIPCIRTFGGHRRFAAKDLDALTELARNRRSRRRENNIPSAS
ncbi:MAG TPA: helix-turn-helix domain-containing protein [Acidimicrobiales bacterium]|nr:helix-turn-helix domain-containing protein [Acidimicrobiales bacterium]